MTTRLPRASPLRLMPPPSPRDRDATTRALLAAAIAQAAAKGYRGFAVRDLTRAVGISSQTYYARFANKESCFAEAVDGLCEQTLDHARQMVAATGDGQRLSVLIRGVLRLAAANPAAARVLLLEAHGGGPQAIAARDRLVGGLAALSAGADAGPLARDIGRAVAGAVARLALDHVADGRARELPRLAEPLIGWAECYRGIEEDALPPAREPPPARRRGRAPGTLIVPSAGGERRLSPGPRREPRSLVVHSQHDRILDAVATVVADQGYDALTVRSLIGHAQISSRAFYTHFASTDDAFAATLVAGGRGALAAALPATMAAADWRDGVADGLLALCEFLAEEPAFAKVALLDALAFGLPGLAAQREALDTLAATLANGYASARVDPSAADVIAEAVAAGTWELCAVRIRDGRSPELSTLAPTLALLALAPVTATDRALAVARRISSATAPSGR